MVGRSESILVYVVLVLLTIYNIRLNFKVFKLKSTNMPRDPRDLSGEELETIKSLTKEKRKWIILGQILFWSSLILVLIGSMGILGFFLDLYTVACIVSNQIDLSATKVLINKNKA